MRVTVFLELLDSAVKKLISIPYTRAVPLKFGVQNKIKNIRPLFYLSFCIGFLFN
jgi:hypothetical protein